MVTDTQPRAVLVLPAGQAYFMINQSHACGPITDRAGGLQVRVPQDARVLAAPIPQYPTIEWCPGEVGNLIIHVTPFVRSVRDVFSKA
jgi:hypothetical protein